MTRGWRSCLAGALLRVRRGRRGADAAAGPRTGAAAARAAACARARLRRRRRAHVHRVRELRGRARLVAAGRSSAPAARCCGTAACSCRFDVSRFQATASACSSSTTRRSRSASTPRSRSCRSAVGGWRFRHERPRQHADSVSRRRRRLAPVHARRPSSPTPARTVSSPKPGSSCSAAPNGARRGGSASPARPAGSSVPDAFTEPTSAAAAFGEDDLGGFDAHGRIVVGRDSARQPAAGGVRRPRAGGGAVAFRRARSPPTATSRPWRPPRAARAVGTSCASAATPRSPATGSSPPAAASAGIGGYLGLNAPGWRAEGLEVTLTRVRRFADVRWRARKTSAGQPAARSPSNQQGPLPLSKSWQRRE